MHIFTLAHLSLLFPATACALVLTVIVPRAGAYLGADCHFGNADF
jgi:hypothetical protein